jgi:tetratricopeptide (TPR) repeat protein
MRFFVLTISSFLFIAAPAWAQNQPLLPEHDGPPTEEILTPDEQVIAPPADDVPLLAEDEAPRIDQLFTDLKRAANPRYAKTIADSIWSEWFRSGSATTDLMMHWANEAVEAKQYNVAMDFLDQVITRQPDYAEGWNRRATLHFTMNNLGKSMTDINRVLALEPRHFGALSGMAIILDRTGRKEAARQAWIKTLEVYPAMQSAQSALMRLEEDLAGDPA